MNVNEIILKLEIMGHYKNKVEENIQKFAAALNLGNSEAILSFYSKDAVFMPDGFKTLKKNQIGRSKLNQLIVRNFKIQFDHVKIATDDNFAFVEAVAITSEDNVVDELKLEKISRDFFVFRKEECDWKIYRYIFNNVSNSQS